MRILYFAWLRERLGLAEETLDIPAEIATVEALMLWLRRRDPAHEAAFAASGTIRCALDQELVPMAASLAGAAEAAFFPPMTGG